LILALESNYYDQINQAQDWFQYAISSDTVNGGFFVVAADVAPWCTSNWHTLRYRVLRPSQRPYNPKVLISGERFIFVNDERPYKIGIDDDTFSLGFIDDEDLKAIDDDEYQRAVNNEQRSDPDKRPDCNKIKFKIRDDKIVPIGK
jgi:hypothetical protein